MPNLGGWEFVILIGILVLLFGAKRLPDMARSIGQSARVFKGEMKGMKGDDPKADPPAPPAPPAALPPTQAPAPTHTAPPNGVTTNGATANGATAGHPGPDHAAPTHPEPIYPDPTSEPTGQGRPGSTSTGQ